MKTNREADLRRKLALAPVPTPPAGLAERIKREIPKHLHIDTDAERKRFAKSAGFSIRVAASVLILTLSAYAIVHLLSRTGEPGPAPAALQRAAENRHEAAPPAEAVTTRPSSPPPAPARLDKVRRARPRSVVAAKKQEEQPRAEGGLAEVRQQADATPAAESKAPANLTARDQIMARASLDERTAPSLLLDHEVTVAPDGRTILRVSIDKAAKDAKVEVEGAKPIAPFLYEIDAAVATIRVRYRQRGEEKTLEQSVKRSDARPWSAASKTMKDAVLRSEGTGPPP